MCTVIQFVNTFGCNLFLRLFTFDPLTECLKFTSFLFR